MTMSASRALHFLSVSEVAELLKVSPKTVRRWIERGDLHVHQIGRQHRIAEQGCSTLSTELP
jgi:excisionase family DNA binding protein